MAKSRKATQEKLAKRFGITQQAISKLVQKGILTRGANLEQWTREAWEYMSGQAAGRKSEDGKLDLVHERARLAARQAEKLELEIARLHNELLPAETVCESINAINNTVKTKLLAVPYRYRTLAPSLTPAQIDALDTLIREILTELSHERLPPEIRIVTEQYFSDLHAAAQADDQPVGGQVPGAQQRKQRRARPMVDESNAVP